MSAFDAIAAAANAVFLDRFGQSVTYEQPPQEAFTVSAIIEEPQQQESVVPGAGAFVPLWVRASDFSTPPAPGDRVTIGTTIYTVTGEPRRDTAGGIHLTLAKSGEIV